MGKVYFSAEEAENILPKVSEQVKKIMDLNEQINFLKSVKVNPLNEGIESALAVTEFNKNFHKLSFQFFQELEELIKMGCILKDVEKGLVDFYSKLHERDIFLCWKIGETGIQYWHEAGTGYPARQPIEILKKEYEKELEQYR